MQSDTEKYYALFPLLFLCLFFVYQSVGHEIHDFANYYFGGYFLGHGDFTPDIYYPYNFNKAITALGSPTLFAGFAPNSPFLAFAFYPFSLLDIEVAKSIFNAISILLFLCSLYRLVTHYKIKPYCLLFIPILFFVPIRNEILFGQVYLLLFFFVAECLLAYENKQFVKSAIFLSLAILLKVFPLLLVLIFIFKKQYRPAFYTLVSCGVLVLATLFFCDFETWIFYVNTVLPKASAGGIASAYVDNYQSAFMFLRRLVVFDQMQNPEAIFDCPSLFYGLNAAFKIALVVIGYYVTRKSDNMLMVFSYWLLAAILMSPYGSTYTFILLLFPLFALIGSNLSNGIKALCVFLLFLINNLPLSLFLENDFPLSYIRLFVLLMFFVGFLVMVYKFVNVKNAVLVPAAFLCLIVFVRNGTPESSVYFLTEKSPLLIYDYKIENNKLTYYYWDQKGENQHSLPIKLEKATPADLSQNNIYFYGKKISSDDGNKLKPMVLDGKVLIYLSDYERGIGFYTLRAQKISK